MSLRCKWNRELDVAEGEWNKRLEFAMKEAEEELKEAKRRCGKEVNAVIITLAIIGLSVVLTLAAVVL